MNLSTDSWQDAQKESQGPPRQVHAQDHSSEEPSSKQM
jgi:hypothetical protein